MHAGVPAAWRRPQPAALPRGRPRAAPRPVPASPARPRATRCPPGPGHTASWGRAYPELLTRCYNTAEGGQGEQLGPINPARNET